MEFMVDSLNKHYVLKGLKDYLSCNIDLIGELLGEGKEKYAKRIEKLNRDNYILNEYISKIGKLKDGERIYINCSKNDAFYYSMQCLRDELHGVFSELEKVLND